LTASTELSAFEMRRLKEKLDVISPTPLLAYAGTAFDNNPKVQQTVPGIYLGENFDEALEKIHDLVKLKEAA
jgi:hypothetical protein